MSTVGALSILVAPKGDDDLFVAAEVLLLVIADRSDEVVVLKGLVLGGRVLA